jgi:spermidine synthase
MKLLTLQPRDILPAAHNPSEVNQQERLAAYWKARQRFLLAGLKIEETDDPRKMLKSVRDPPLRIVRQDQDFTPAYDPLLVLA